MDTSENGYATKLGEKICDLVTSMAARTIELILRGFFLAIGALMAYSLWNYLTLWLLLRG